jgi:hypothetical protein
MSNGVTASWTVVGVNDRVGFVGWRGVVATAFVLNVMLPCAAMAWGYEGHEIIALIAQAHLDPTVLKKGQRPAWC